MKLSNQRIHRVGGFLLVLVVSCNASYSQTGRELFDQRIVEWKEIVAKLQYLRLEHSLAANREESSQFREQFEATKIKGEEKIREIKSAAAKAFRESPSRGTDYFSFLRNTLPLDLEQKEDQTIAYEMASALATKPITEPDLARRVGMSLFINGDFTKAKELLEFAISRNATQEFTGIEKQLQLIPRLQPLWEREQQFRKKDAESELPIATIETTKGSFDVLLFEDQAPNTVKNFITLAEQGYYEDMDFFLVNPFGFAFTGKPIGPGYVIKNEGKDRENRRDNFRGSFSVPARDEGSPHLSPSVFLVTFVPYAEASTDKYCNFGRVIRGMPVVDSLTRSSTLESKPVEGFVPDKVKKITIRNKRDHDYKPEKIVDFPQ
jgi:cyclophilin family peptidyl-prolyl cis-trans isomerase